MPLLEETGYVPTEKYASAAELFEHARRIGEHYELYSRALFQTQVLDLTWDEAAAHCAATTDHGDTVRARWLLAASGPLNRPKLPGITGIDTVQGLTVHNRRWAHPSTGRDNHDNS